MSARLPVLKATGILGQRCAPRPRPCGWVVARTYELAHEEGEGDGDGHRDLLLVGELERHGCPLAAAAKLKRGPA